MVARRVLTFVWIFVCAAGVALGQTVWIDHPGNPVIEPGEPGEWDDGWRDLTGVVHDGSMYHLYFVGIDEGQVGQLSIGHATSTDGVDWTMDPNNPVLTPGPEGEWDDEWLYGAAVIYEGGEFHMWFHGFDGERFRCGYATSPDGSSWTKYSGNPVIDVGPPGSFDESGVLSRSVVFDGETYRMWYTGQDLPNLLWSIGYAESPDGISWTKHPSPVLTASEPWESFDVGIPSVVFDGSIYHMWYTGNWPPSSWRIGYAYSRDGIEWAKNVDNPVIGSSQEPAGAAAVFFDGSTYHMWYDFPSTLTIGYATSECCAGVCCRHFIPAAAVASGAQGSFFQTDVDINNGDDIAAIYQFIWLPRGEDNTDPLTSDDFTLGAGMSARYSNVLSEVFGLEPNSLGALAVETNSPYLMLMSRTYNLPETKAGGTYGQMMPAIPQGDMIPVPERRRLVFMSDDADYRANVGCQSANRERTVTVRIELFNQEGTMLGAETMVLQPWSNDQLNRVFGDHAPVSGYVDVWAITGGGSYYCYGSVLDNVTSDPTTILPQ
jgi:predicted GH43/DUF377 family glycosyl hydrolase